MSSTRLTKRVVEQTLAGPKPRFVWDSELRGFGVRVEPTGTKTFVLRYRPRASGPSGPKRFLTIGRFGVLTADQARDKARSTLGTISMGHDPADEVATKKNELTFKTVVELFLKDHVAKKRKPRTYEDYESLLTLHALPLLGTRKISEITRADLSKIHAKMSDRPYRANRLLAVIGSLYSFAEGLGLVPEQRNPARRIEKYKEEGRERYLTSAELERFGATLVEAETVGVPWQLSPGKAASKHLPHEENRVTLLPVEVTAAIRLLIFTGARLREVLSLRWEHIDVERGLLLLPDSKTGRKTIVLNRAALAVVAALPRSGTFLIPGRTLDTQRSDLNRPWKLVSARAGLAGVRLHDLRHTFASVGAGSSLGLPIVGKLLGHSQPQTTARYAHLDADPIRRATNTIGDHLEEALRGKR